MSRSNKLLQGWEDDSVLAALTQIARFRIWTCRYSKSEARGPRTTLFQLSNRLSGCLGCCCFWILIECEDIKDTSRLKVCLSRFVGLIEGALKGTVKSFFVRKSILSNEF